MGKNNVRIIFSGLAIGFFFLAFIFSKIFVNDFTNYHQLGWRLSVIIDIALFIPIVSLFVSTVCERKLKYVDSRIYLFFIFANLVFESILFETVVPHLSEFYKLTLNIFPIITSIVFSFRVVNLLLLPFGYTFFLKFLCVFMILLDCVALVFEIATDGLSSGEDILYILSDISFNWAFFTCDKSNMVIRDDPWFIKKVKLILDKPISSDR